MSSITNVAIAGSAGSLGSVVLKKLLAASNFKVTILQRAGSTSEPPAGANVATVDYESPESLKSALQGQDAVVVTLPAEALSVEFALIDAAVAAGVKRFIPSEFGSNLDNANARQLPVFAIKVKAQDYIIEKAKKTDLSYTFIYNAAFLDWGLQFGFVLDISKSKPTLIDGGDLPFSTTTLDTVGDAVVGVLNHPDETKNRAVYVHDVITTQNKILEHAKQLAPERPWEPKHVKLEDTIEAANARLAKGLYDLETFAPYLHKAVVSPIHGGKFEKTDNELLGLKPKGEEAIVEALRPLLK